MVHILTLTINICQSFYPDNFKNRFRNVIIYTLSSWQVNMKALDKVLDVLDVFLKLEADNLSISELTRLSGLNKATVIRIVADLVKKGYLNQPEKRGKYYLGNKFLNFSRIINQKRKLRQIALPHMHELANAVSDCVILATYEDYDAIISEIVDSEDLLRAAPRLGTRVPLYCTAVGKIKLASLSALDLGKYLRNHPLVRRTQYTIIDPAKLKKELEIIAEEYVAYEYEEQFSGIGNVASPIRDANGIVIAAVGVLGPTVRISPGKMREIAPEIINCARWISIELGYESYSEGPLPDRLGNSVKKV